MKNRKSHHKSRAGCQNCKRKHVKCDEQGPPCANCISRQTADTCKYGNGRGNIGRGSGSPGEDAASSASSIQNLPSQQISQVQSQSRSLPQSPIDLTYGTRHLLEMALVHRWSTSTFKSFCGVEEDEKYLQLELPIYALRHDYLLQGILATTALELATTTHAGHMLGLPTTVAEYTHAAMEYYDRASRSFRAQLRNATCNITQQTFHCIFIFSTFAACFNVAMPQITCKPAEAEKQSQATQTLLARAPGLLQMISTSTYLFTRRPEWIRTSPLGPSILKAAMLLEGPSPKLDDDTEAALVRVEAVIVGSIDLSHSVASVNAFSATSESVLASTRAGLYRQSSVVLRQCYVEDAKNSIKAFCIAFPSLVGSDFISAVRNLDPVALFVLMHWAVMLDRLGRTFWWVGSVGRDLVLEISSMLLQLCPEGVEALQWREGIDWTRRQVDKANIG